MSNIKEEIKTSVVSTPGVYKWLNKNNTVIYVGKAVNLKSRMLSYFNSKRLTTITLMSEVNNFEVIETANERDALLLEQNLIKKIQPKFNIKIKFTSPYPYIRVSKKNNKYVVSISRNAKWIKDSKVFGPFPSGWSTHSIVKLINDVYPIDKCLNPNTGIPCLNYQMNKCLGHCVRTVQVEEYETFVNEITDFLRGNVSKFLDRVKTILELESENRNYEKAKSLFSSITFIEKYREKQSTFYNDSVDRDFIAFSHLNDYFSISTAYVRGGKLVDIDNRMVRIYSENSLDGLTSHIESFYSDAYKPNILFADVDLSELGGLYDIEYREPSRGKDLDIYNSALLHSETILKKELKILMLKDQENESAENELKKVLGIETINHIEMIDVSSNYGYDQVAGVVSFINGSWKKSLYRKYIIDSLDHMDDYKSMEEASFRHFSNKINNNLDLPDLFIVDGKHQTKNVIKSIQKLGLDVKVIGLVKNEKHMTEKLFINGKDVAFPSKDVSRFVGKIQDEVHRFTLNFMKSRRDKRIKK